MALPAVLSNFHVFHNGTSYAGLVTEVELPPLVRSMTPYLAGGMSGPVDLDNGPDGPIEFGWKCGGLVVDVLRQYGAVRHDAVQIRFAGAYQRADTGEVLAVEIVVRGRHKEIALGTAKVGEQTEFAIKTTCSYYRLTVNGATEIECDRLSMIEIVGGVDRLAQRRAALGL
ncbi:phage major tail tube protein [Lysobacter sp. K5869]|uniref:phage major tail tube protein n=1 Tax=Lysobacter sp. K5869 TaxID=2820808 RepID=UPI001C0614DD|nr:phage major tail tube protein [Lysobacter sp. K5869]QWP76077.1 phage major tail tube protein [Lysobacter sp. K5869]